MSPFGRGADPICPLPTDGYNAAVFCERSAAGHVEQDLAEAVRLGIRSTPVVLIGLIEGDSRVKPQLILTGIKSAGTYSSALDSLLGR